MMLRGNVTVVFPIPVVIQPQRMFAMSSQWNGVLASEWKGMGSSCHGKPQTIERVHLLFEKSLGCNCLKMLCI